LKHYRHHYVLEQVQEYGIINLRRLGCETDKSHCYSDLDDFTTALMFGDLNDEVFSQVGHTKIAVNFPIPIASKRDEDLMHLVLQSMIFDKMGLHKRMVQKSGEWRVDTEVEILPNFNLHVFREGMVLRSLKENKTEQHVFLEFSQLLSASPSDKTEIALSRDIAKYYNNMAYCELGLK